MKRKKSGPNINDESINDVVENIKEVVEENVIKTILTYPSFPHGILFRCKVRRNYMEDLIYNLGTSRIEVISLKYLYKEFAWLFARIIGLESTMFVSRNVIYAMDCAHHEKSIIDWGYLILSEMSFQLNNLKNTQMFYTISYLIFTKHVDLKLEPIYA
jgi:hypothetical protein